MSFRIKKHEPVADGVLRVCLEELDGAQELLAEARNHTRALHEARKNFKRIRALFELGRPAFNAGIAGPDAQIQRAARMLAQHRESEALRALLERELRVAGSSDFDILETSLMLHLMAHHPVANRARDLMNAAKIVTAVRKTLVNAGTREMPQLLCLRRWRKSYKAARRNYHAARDNPSTDAMHAFRKRAKRLLNQSRLLRTWGNRELTQFRAQLEAIDDLLGRSRDCGLLGVILRGVPAAEAPLRRGYGFRACLERTARDTLAEALELSEVAFASGSRRAMKQVFR